MLVVSSPAPVATRPDAQHRPSAAPAFGAPVQHRLVRPAHLLGERQQLPPGLGQGDLPRGALEQPSADPILEPGDLLAERRRRDAEPRCGPAEVQLLGEHAEVLEHRDGHVHVVRR